MAISVKKRRKIEKVVTVEYDGETADVRYRPAAITKGLSDDILEQDFKTSSQVIAYWLSQVVVSWDVLDEDDKPMEPTPELMSQLEPQFLSAVRDAIVGDMSPNPKSGEGSFTG